MSNVFVTAFYEIAATENPTQASKTDFYFENAAALLTCPVRFVVYCDPKHADRVRALRADALVVGRPFQHFPQHAWIERIGDMKVAVR